MPSDTSGLSQYVRRVMKLKGLTQNDVERMSGGRITDGYVASITTNRATNLSVEKLVALADGLGVDADELFHVARGLPEDEQTTTYTTDALNILETVQKVVASPEVTEILDEALRMSPEKRRLLLKLMKRVGAGKSKLRSKGRKPGNHAP